MIRDRKAGASAVAAKDVAAASVAAASVLAVIALCVMLLWPAPVVGIELDRYTSDVHEARLLVQDAVGQKLDEREATDLAIHVNLLVPSSSDVEMADGAVHADNSIVRTLISKLDAADTTGERTEIVDDLYAHLLSLESALGEPTADSVPHDPEALSQLLADAPADTVSPLAELFGDLIEWLAEVLEKWWTSLGGSPGANTAITTVTITIIVVLVLLLVFLLVRLFLHWRKGMTARDKPVIEAHIGQDLVVEAARDLPKDPLAYADECAAAGRMREAVRALFGGAARGLQERGYIVEACTRTNHELLLEVHPRSEEIYIPLEELTRTFEVVWYGHRDVDADGFSAARERYVEIEDTSVKVGERP